LEVQEGEAGWTLAPLHDDSTGKCPDVKTFSCKHVDDGQYVVMNKASEKTLFLREGAMTLERVDDATGDADALWRVESVDEEFDILEFFYPSEVIATIEGHAPFDKPRGEGIHGPRQLRAGGVAEGGAPELAAEYDLLDDAGHWKFVPVNQLSGGKYWIQSAANPAVGLTSHSQDPTPALDQIEESSKRFKWRISPLGNGYYTIFNKSNKKALDGGSEETESGAKPSVSRKDASGRPQQWKIIPHAIDDGCYHICCHSNFLALDGGRKGEVGTAVLLKDFSPDEPSHKWTIVPCTEGHENSCASDAETDEEQNPIPEPAAAE